MSIRVMSDVWDHSRHEGPKLLMLLAIADCCNDQRQAWPSLRRLSELTRVTERRVRQILRELEESGELITSLGAGMETAKGATNCYEIAVLDGGKVCADDGGKVSAGGK